MKKRCYIVIWVALLATALLFAVTGNTQLSGKPVKLPPFKLIQANGKVYKAENLPVGKPVLLIYFSPDCDHCIKLMNEYFKTAEGFQKASVVMITYLPLDRVATFGKNYKVQKFPNLVVGTEGMTFFVRNYYNLTEMPFAALHDKNGNLIKSYSREVPLQGLLHQLNHLK